MPLVLRGEGQKVVGSEKSLHGPREKQITVASAGGTPHVGALPGGGDNDRRKVGTMRNRAPWKPV